MKFKIFRLSKGTTDFPLGDFIGNIKSVKFATDEDNYEIQLLKYGKSKSQDRCTVTKNDNFHPIYFTLCRDAKTCLQIISTCDGIFEFEYEIYKNNTNDNIVAQHEKIKKMACTKFYSQFYSVNDERLLIDENVFQNYAYHSSEVELFKLLNRNKECVERNTSNFVVSHIGDVIFGFDIVSEVNTMCQIYGNNQIILSFEIKPSNNYYPCLLILASLQYTELVIKFDDKVNSVKYNGVMVNSGLLDLFKKYAVVVKYRNGINMEYVNGMFK